VSLRFILILGVLASVCAASLAPAESDEANAIDVDAALGSIPSVTVSTSTGEVGDPEAKTPVWVPTEVGRRWTYVYVRQQTRVLGDEEPVVEKLRGTRIDEITALAPEFGQGVIRVHSRLSGRQYADEPPSTEEWVSFMRYGNSSYQLVAEQTTDPASGIASIVRYDTPLSLLESGAKPGQRWKVGVRSRGDLHTDLEGEVLGAQDVQTPYGLFKHCLVIRLTGQISGVVEVYGSRMEVPTGEVTLTEWYAPGVGLVLAKEERSQTLVFEDGTRMEYSERTQFALRSTDSPATAVPAAGEQ
jgi:hypothetical protein